MRRKRADYQLIHALEFELGMRDDRPTFGYPSDAPGGVLDWNPVVALRAVYEDGPSVLGTLASEAEERNAAWASSEFFRRCLAEVALRPLPLPRVLTP